MYNYFSKRLIKYELSVHHYEQIQILSNVVHVDIKKLSHYFFCNYRLSLHLNPI